MSPFLYASRSFHFPSRPDLDSQPAIMKVGKINRGYPASAPSPSAGVGLSLSDAEVDQQNGRGQTSTNSMG
jgi:hypothetical protein